MRPITPIVLSVIAHLCALVAVGGVSHGIYNNKQDKPVMIELTSLVINEQPAHKKVSATASGCVRPPRHIQEKTGQPDALTEQAKDTAGSVHTMEPETGNSAVSVPASSVSESSFTKSNGNNEMQTAIVTEELRKKYTAEHFRYIGNLISQHTVYPADAQEQGLEGIVYVQFEVKSDGTVGAISVTASSGSDILDRDAIATVQRSSPFPQPPVHVALSFPLKYSLR